jgi:hypothetical protein
MKPYRGLLVFQLENSVNQKELEEYREDDEDSYFEKGIIER